MIIFYLTFLMYKTNHLTLLQYLSDASDDNELRSIVGESWDET